MRWWHDLLVVGAALGLGACASAPRGPSVMVLPGAGKPLEQFQQDDAACRQWAGQQIAASRGDSFAMQRSYDIAYQQCMYSRGNQIPGAPLPPPPPPAGPPGR